MIRGMRAGLLLVVAHLLIASHLSALGQPARRAVSSVDVQRLANGALGVMSFTVAPDVTTSSLAISSAAIGSPGLTMSQFGGGFTWSRTLPLYLEGNAAYSRFDPVFVATEGAEQRIVPVKCEGHLGYPLASARPLQVWPEFAWRRAWVRCKFLGLAIWRPVGCLFRLIMPRRRYGLPSLRGRPRECP